jgi:hypothetical protein
MFKLGIVEKEVSETVYWFELIQETWQMTQAQKTEFARLFQESKELLALFSTISRKSKLSDP